MSHLFLDVTANFLPGHSRSRNFLKKWEGGFLVSTLRLSDSDFEGKLWIAKIRFSKLISKSVSSIPIESHFDTQKFEFSAPNYPKILIFASKFKFFFDQNLDFVLGRQAMDPQDGGVRKRRGIWADQTTGVAHPPPYPRVHQHRNTTLARLGLGRVAEKMI